MTPHNDLKPANAIVGEKSQALLALWSKLKGDRMAPKREEVTLTHVRALSPWVWTIDVVDGGADFRFRLAGDRIIQFLGKRYSGSLMSSLPESPFFERLHRTLSYSVEHKRPVAVGPVRSDYEGTDHWEVEAVALPLSDDGENVTGFLGAMEVWPLGTKTKKR
ncbi:MAG: PAS domain-containing protein [Alphaproteobacteria bacterium]|nr:PAS domain-containing protein [Alphaproteobacteria bacterium]MDE2494355.1 PAS domain-containing protein [Alphaproteobacteria bacterium]